MSDRMELRIGEERAVHLPAGTWTVQVEGMQSAVEVRKLWQADPYPEEDDDEGEESERPAPDVVFMVRAAAPGTATLHFRGGGQSRTVQVEVRM